MPNFQKFLVVGTVFVSISLAPPISAAENAAPELLSVVVVSRHGVRSPTQSLETLQKWSQKEWPQWGVPRGYLTGRGFDLVRRTWEAELKNPVFAYSACPAPGQVRIIADVDERTIKTGEALSDGLYGGCGVPVEVTDEPHSSLFSPLKAGVCAFENSSELQRRVSARSRRTGEQYGSVLEKLSAITDSPLSGAVAAEVYPKKIKLIGPLYKASSIVEIFALEWGEFPNRLPGWGQVDEKLLEEELMPMRVAVFSAVNRDREVALSKGSALASAVLKALEGPVKYTFFIGHDTNLANLGAIFGLNWKLPGRAVNENTPGGYLIFEKWKVQGRVQIHIFYSALSPSQMRASAIEGRVPRMEIPIPTHSYPDWEQLSAKKLLPRCIPAN
jgi:4-phytase/acid phosphatase